MVLSIIFLEDKHKIVLHLSIFYEYQQFFQHRICFSIQPPDYSDPWPRLARSSSFFSIMLFNQCFIIIYISIRIVDPPFYRQNHVWSFMTKYLRFLCKFTSWSGETPTGNFSDVFFILDKNNERPDWMTDLKHTDNAW
jgi:hypothetical protein